MLHVYCSSCYAINSLLCKLYSVNCFEDLYIAEKLEQQVLNRNNSNSSWITHVTSANHIRLWATLHYRLNRMERNQSCMYICNQQLDTTATLFTVIFLKQTPTSFGTYWSINRNYINYCCIEQLLNNILMSCILPDGEAVRSETCRSSVF